MIKDDLEQEKERVDDVDIIHNHRGEVNIDNIYNAICDK